MSELIYLDTNVFLDYCLGTKEITPYDEYAKQILDRTLDCEFTIIVSSIVLHELKKKIDPSILFAPLKIKYKIKFIDFTSEDVKNSKKIPIHFPDNLHIFLAEKHACKYLVT
ncbi:MAG: type II toxin-antitoxin system VapC family toxin, partial [Candidatus Woesearchaeota archaeon]